MKTLRALALLLTLATPPLAAFETISADETLSGGSMGEFGLRVAVDGALAAVLSPGDLTIQLFTFDTSTQGWTVGPTLSPSGAVGLGPAVAVSGLTVFYSVITDFGANPPATQTYEVRAQRLFPSPQVVTLIASPGAAPAALAAAEDVVLLGVPRGDGNVQSHMRVFGYDGSTWSQLLQRAAEPFDLGYGSAVATDGTWFAVGDPAEGDNGAVEILIRQPGGGVGYVNTIVYENPLQSGARFGASVAVDEDCLVVGAPGYNRGFIPPTPDTGAIVSYGLNQFGLWTPQETVVPEGALEDDAWGDSLSLAGANLVLGGQDVQRLNANPQGDAALFRRSGTSCAEGSWSEYARLRATPLVIDPDAPADFGAAVAIDELSGVLVGDPMGPTGEGDGRAYAYSASLLVLFTDGFETGDLSQWSASVP